ncbi:MAG: transglycosylase SLT domain-containing protein [Myxococcota bacterium]|nr:transglycosylase SLT domain-containing protein [Myxococcota bacterium]
MNREASEAARGPGRGWLGQARVLASGAGLAGLALVLATSAGASPRPDGAMDTGTRSAVEGPAADRILRARSQTILHDPAATLKSAQAALEERDRSHAVWLLEQLIERHPVVGDYASLLQARILLEDGRVERAARVATQALGRFLNSPVRAELNVLLGDARADQQRSEAALAAWRAALSESRDGDLRANVLLSIASLEERAGRDAEAAITYTLIWYAHPTTAEAQVAAHRLELLEELLGDGVRSATDWRRRADRLYRQLDNEGALAAYDRALALGLVGREAERARKQRARTLFRLRRYDAAVAAFGALTVQGDQPIWYARSLARADRVPESIAEFERIGSGKPSAQAMRARYLAGILLEGRALTDRADTHFRAVEASHRSAGLNQAAGWRLGWSAYGQGHYAEAIGYFDRLIATLENDPVEQLKPRYWRARALERGDLGDAPAEFAAMASEFPLSYYGWRAGQRVGAARVPRAPSSPPAKGRNRLASSDLERARILLEAGMNAEAQSEIRRLGRRVRGLHDRLDLAHLASDSGDFHLAHRIVVEGYSEPLARGPVPYFEDLWWYAWPSAYLPLVDRATDRPGSVPPALVYSIMREESGFRAEVVSPVGARGLLQIMVETGHQLADRHGVEDFDGEDLFDPQVNIELGASYLADLEDRFAGRLSASVASYNAGPQAVSSWRVGPTIEDDEWVEGIPYSQTRSYVKRVLRSLNAYQVLY